MQTRKCSISYRRYNSYGQSFRRILHLSPLRLGVPNALPKMSAEVSILKLDLVHSYCNSLFPSGNHHP